LNRQNKILVFFIGINILFGTSMARSYAEGTITFGPRQGKIEGSIPYSIIGKYRAGFSVFKGRITLDDHWQKVRSVYLEIEASSIRSKHPGCDKVARSRRLLNAARYPKIIFKSDKIIHDESGYKVNGILEMHGIKRRMTFSFKAVFILDPETKGESLDLKGTWRINRKDFNIIWNKYLDHGGIIVGDYLTVDWGIKADIHD
jgi:polyisoprenoid-binding protein YceI